MTASPTRNDWLTLGQQVCFTLSVANREIIALYRPLLEPLGLTHPQYLVMVALWSTEGPISVKRLSQLLQLDPPSLSPLLKRLQNAGLVERQRDPSDERALQISLSQRGRDLRARAVAVPTAIVERLGMTVGELESLQGALTKVIEHATHQMPRRSTESAPTPSAGWANDSPGGDPSGGASRGTAASRPNPEGR